MGKALAIAAALAAVACQRDPNVTYAHMLERAASWSASVQFAGDLAKRQQVPRTYLHDLLSTAVTEVDAIREQIESDDDVPATRRSHDATACRRLTSMLQNADRAGAVVDDGALRDVEALLRDAARRARSPREARR